MSLHFLQRHLHWLNVTVKITKEHFYLPVFMFFLFFYSNCCLFHCRFFLRAEVFTLHYSQQAVQSLQHVQTAAIRWPCCICDCMNTMPHQTFSAPACHRPIQTQQPISLELSLGHLTAPVRALAAIVKLFQFRSNQDLVCVLTSANRLPLTMSGAVIP